MISPEMFNKYFLPRVEEQTRWVERTIYHLDGPGAVKHLDSLLELPDLNGIQWVPGAGAPPMREWVPLLKRVQESGKLLYIGCAKEEVEFLVRTLRPEGLLLETYCDSIQEADELLKNIKKIKMGTKISIVSPYRNPYTPLRGVSKLGIVSP